MKAPWKTNIAEDKFPPRKTNFRLTAAIRAREPSCNTLTVDTAAAVFLLVYSAATLGGGTGATIANGPLLGGGRWTRSIDHALSREVT